MRFPASAFSIPEVRLLLCHPHLQPQPRPSSRTVQQKQEVEQLSALSNRQLSSPRWASELAVWRGF